MYLSWRTTNKEEDDLHYPLHTRFLCLMLLLLISSASEMGRAQAQSTPAVACSEVRPCTFGRLLDTSVIDEARKKAENALEQYESQQKDLREQLLIEIGKQKKRIDENNYAKDLLDDKKVVRTLPPCSNWRYWRTCVPNCVGHPNGYPVCKARCLENLLADGVICQP